MSEFDFSDAVNPFAQNKPEQTFDFSDAVNPFSTAEFTENLSRVEGLQQQPEWLTNHRANQPKDRSWSEAAADTGQGVMKSLAGVADAAMHTGEFIDEAIPLGGLTWKDGDILPSYKSPSKYQAAKEQGMATPTKATGDAMDYWEQGKSKAIQQDAQYLANADGFVDTFKRVGERPRAIGNAIADSIGYMVPGMAAARAAKVAGATGAGITGAVAGTGAVVEGGAARSQAVGEVMDMPLGQLLERSPDYQTLVKSGVDPEAARMRVAADAGFTAQAIAIPVSLLASKITGAAKIEGDFFTGQGAKDFFTGLFRQAGEEAAQEVGSQFGVNVGIAENADNTREYSQGLENAAAMGAIMGPAQQTGMKAIDVAGQKLRSIGPVSVQDDGGVDQPMNGEQLGGIVDDLPVDGSPPLQLGHNPQRMIVLPDGTTAWESELDQMPPSTAAQHPGYARLSETPDDIEQSLSGEVDIDRELAALMAELNHAESIAREAAPVMAQGVNPFDRFDADAQPEGLFDGIRKEQNRQREAAIAAQRQNDELAAAVLQNEDEQRGFMGQVSRLQEQSALLPVRDGGPSIDELQDVYPPDPASNARPGRADQRLNASIPEGLKDHRLARPEYRNQLERMSRDLVRGGGIGYVRDEHDRITGRTPSLNPDWFKSMGENPETAMSVADTQVAIKKALSGETLGVRQARAVGAALDAIGNERGNYAREIRAMRENARANRRKAFEDWLAATNAPLDAEFESEVWPDSPGETFAEADYLPESTMESRAISELANTADSYGVDWKEIDGALESGDIESQTKALTQLIWNAKIEHRQTAKQPEQSAASAQSRSSASESATGTLEKESANQAQSAAEIIDSAAAEAATSPENNLPEPTEAQKEAGNYKKAHVNIQGLDIAIENPRGSTRSGTDNTGKPWSVTMHNHYGYIKRTEGADGDHVDVFIGPNPDSDKVFIVDQVNADGSFDENKILIGFDSKLKARSGYKSNYSNGWKVGPITSMSMDEFKGWLKNGDTKKPLSDHFAGAGNMAGDQSEKVLDMVPTSVSAPKSDQKPVKQSSSSDPQPSARVSVSSAQNIEDTGEKLWGARKDELRTLRERLDDMDDERIANSTLTQLFPKGEIDKVENKLSAAIYHAARGLIPSKPRTPYKLQRWVDTVKQARELIQIIEEVGPDKVFERLKSASSQGLRDIGKKIEVLNGVDRKHWDRVGRVLQASGKYRVNGEMIDGSWVEVSIDDRRKSFYGHDDISSALPEINQELNGKSAPESRMKFTLFRDTSSDLFFIAKDGDKEKRRLKTFTDRKEARNFLSENYDELVSAWDAVKNRDNVTKADMRRSVNAERSGVDYRNGKDVSAQEFLDNFGFRGVEFGNWVKQGGGSRERQSLLNDAYDAFMDLSSILNLPPKAMSLEGRLGIGMGSRGRGKAAAHYEPDSLVINLTKTNGAGSLAHEWFHALDNYFAHKREIPVFKGDNSAYRQASFVTYLPEPMLVLRKSLESGRHPYPLTRAEVESRRKRDPNTYAESEWVEDPNHKKGVRPAVEKAFAELVKTLNESPMTGRAKIIDNGKVDGYWSQIIERAARSFESYVIVRLADKGYRNDFLANVMPLADFPRDPGRYPYLSEDEITPVAEAFDRLFDTLEHKQEGDNVSLFSLGDKTANGMNISDVQNTVSGIIKSWGNKHIEFKVVKSIDGLPGVAKKKLEAANKDNPDKQITAKAFYHDGAIYLNASALRDPVDVERAIFHEVHGHYGARALFGKDTSIAMGRLYLAMGGQKGIRDIAKKHNIDLSRYDEILKGESPGKRAEILTDELLAHIAQESKPGVKRWLQELIGAIRTWLRAHGFKNLGQFSDSEIMALLKRTREAATDLRLDGGSVARILTEANSTESEFSIPSSAYSLIPSKSDVAIKKAATKSGRPAFSSEALKLYGIRKLFVGESDFDPKNELPLGHVESVTPGAEVWIFGIDIDGRAVGNLVADVIDGDIKAIHNIKFKSKKNGFGEQVISSILARSKGDVKIIDIIPQSLGFWEKMGVSFLDPYGNASLNWNDYAAAKRKRIERASISGARSRKEHPLGSSVQGRREYDGNDLGDAKRATGSERGQDPSGKLTDDERQWLDDQLRFSLSDSETRPSGGFSVSGVMEKLGLGKDNRGSSLPPNVRAAYDMLGGKDKTFAEKVKQQVKRQLAPGGLLPREIFDLKIARDAEMNSEDNQQRYILEDFYAQVEEVYKKPYQQLKNATRKEIDDYLKGDRTNVQLTKSMVEVLSRMRKHIQNLSAKYMDELLLDAASLEAQGKTAEADEKRRLIATITENFDTYLHRSYRAFDDPDWPKKVPPEVYQTAVNYLAKQYAGDEAVNESHIREATKKVDLMLHEGTAYDSMAKFISESKLGSKDLSVLKKRKQISPEIRALLGEYEDPAINYAKSVSKMTRLVSNTAFLRQMRDLSLELGFIFEEKNRPLGANKKIAADATEVYSPLNGLYTYPEFEQALRDAVGGSKEPDWYKSIVTANAVVKYGKTVLAPTTAMRNFLSASMFCLTSGHWNLAHLDKSIKTVKTYFTGQDVRGSREYITKLLKLGVLYDAPNYRELQDLIRQVNEGESITAKALRKSKVATALNYAQEFYALGDDFWKILGFENEKAMLMKHKGMTEAQAEKEAAERIRNTYPTYSMTGRGIQMLRRFPLIGSFPSFPAEIIRTTYHKFRYFHLDAKELGYNNPAVIAKGVGLALGAGMMGAISALSAAMFGVDDDEEDAIRSMLPEWSQNSNLLFLGRDESGQVEYMDLTWLDPYSYWKKPLTALARDRDLDENAGDAAWEALSPFLGVDIAFGAALQFFDDLTNPGVTTEKSWEKLGKSLAPGIFNNGLGFWNAADETITKSGKKYTFEDEALALIGFRKGTLNAKVGLTYQAYGYQDKKRAAATVLRDKATDLGKVDIDDLRSAYEQSMEMHKDAWDEMRRIVKLAQKVGMTKSEAIAALRTSGISLRDARLIVADQEFRYQPPKNMMKLAIKRASILFDQETQAELKERAKSLRELQAKYEEKPVR